MCTVVLFKVIKSHYELFNIIVIIHKIVDIISIIEDYKNNFLE